MTFRIIAFVSLLVISSQANAWGPSGQTITVSLAEKYLTARARMAVSKILNGSSLSSVATWADQARREEQWSQTSSWHYIDRESAKSQMPGNVRDAIEYCREKLSSDDSDSEKLVWLKFLVHFVGDLHQPMHVGNPSDRGGNLTKVSYRGKQYNLHALWDGAFIDDQRMSVSAYVERLINSSRPIGQLRETFSKNSSLQLSVVWPLGVL